MATTEHLMTEVYEELRWIARSYRRQAGSNGTLQTTALVHEAYLRLCRGDPDRWQSRAHFLAVAARAMRQILANHARASRAVKRGGHHRAEGRRRVNVDDVALPPGIGGIDVLVLHELLERLGELDRRQLHIVECRLFAGMTVPEIAQVLEVSTSTVEREWRSARAWLTSELGDGVRT